MKFQSWLGRQARGLYKQLRHPRLRRTSKWRAWLGKHVLDKQLWKSDPDKLAWSLALGLFLSLQPIPVQMPLGLLCALRWRLNIPAVLIPLALTNPATWPFTFFPAAVAGGWMLKHLGILHEWRGWEEIRHFDLAHPFQGSWQVLVALVFGCLVVGTVLGACGYGTVHLIYRLRRPDPPLPPGAARA